jgi:hypothetical protein
MAMLIQLCILFIYGTGVSTQGFTLAKQALYCLSHTSSTFCSGYFGDEVSQTILPRVASNSDPPDLTIPSS